MRGILQRIPSWARYGFGILIGVLIGLYIPTTGALSVKRELSADGLLGAGTTIIAAWIIAVLVQRLVQNSEREKTYLLKRLDMLSNLASELEDMDDKLYTEVAATLKQMRLAANVIRRLVTALSRNDIDQSKFDFGDDISALRKLATDTPIDAIKEHVQNADCDARVKDGIIKLTQEREDELRAAIQSLERRIVEAEVCVIRA